MNAEAIKGLMNASPEKRYKNFLNTVTDLEEIWFLSSDEGYATFDIDGFVHVLVWPKVEFCMLMKSEEETPISMDIHDFLENCSTFDDTIRFMVFPTYENSYVVTVDQLCADIEDCLSELE